VGSSGSTVPGVVDVHERVELARARLAANH
jgi:hypothetical protein